MQSNDILNWLLEGDVSIQYQVYKDLLQVERSDLQKRIQSEGWGKQFLVHQNTDGHWGKSYYNPKWTCTHYTLLTLKNVRIHPSVKSIQMILDQILYQDQPFEPAQKLKHATILYDDVCVNGMFLNFASYFAGSAPILNAIVDFILSQQMDDGGFNCQKNRKGARHSSMHSTISVLEGLHEFISQGSIYRQNEILRVKKEAEEFLLMHQLYKSDRNGRIISEAFLKFPYPSRWRYDILRAMDYFQNAEVAYDDRMESALDFILSKRMNSGKWRLNAKYPGKTFFEMESGGKESRWNTLRALRVMKRYIEYTGLDLVYDDLLNFK
jgi:hypothetical protein